MSDSNPILFFSDAHFGAHGSAQEKLKSERFAGLLRHAREMGAEVFFLGDLFDFWFEYRHWIPKTAVEVPAAIRSFTAEGGVFHLVLGNHDFWGEDYFERYLGVQVHRDDLTLVRQGLRLYVSHGDGMAASDRGYRRLRRILRWRPYILLYRLWPADWAYRAAHFFSNRSRDLTAGRPRRFLAEYERVASELLGSGFDAVVTGHLHQGSVERIGEGSWVDTGEFFERFTYVILENGRFRAERWEGTGT